MEDEEDEKAYVPFVVNRTLSYFSDSVLLANEMNRLSFLDNKLQYSFLINTIRRRKRFSKWAKYSPSNDLEVVKEYYGYNDELAHQALKLLSEEQINLLKEKVSKGGRRK